MLTSDDVMLFSKILSINKLKPKWATVCDKIFFLLKNSTVVVKNKNKDVPIKIVYKNKSTFKVLVTRKDIVIKIVKNTINKFLLLISDLIYLSLDPKTINIKKGTRKGIISL